MSKVSRNSHSIGWHVAGRETKFQVFFKCPVHQATVIFQLHANELSAIKIFG